jgi:hypothetical protein
MQEQPKQQPKQAQTPRADKPPKKPLEWGLTQADCLEAWAGKDVVVELASGKAVRGALVGHDQFHLTLRVNGAVVLVCKGRVELVQASNTRSG